MPGIVLVLRTNFARPDGEVPVLSSEAEDAENLVVRTPLASMNDDLQYSDRGRRYWLGAYMHGVCQSGVFPKMALQ